jgi:general stress protein 26
MDTQEKQHQEIWNIIKDMPVAMLTTHGSEGLHSRPMRIIQEGYTGTLYFFAPSDAEVISETVANREVNVTFVDQKEGNYLSLTGAARISSNKALAAELWNEDLEQWFPKGKDGGEAILLELRMKLGERWAMRGGISGLVERVRAFAMSDKAAVEINEKFRQ